MLRLGVVGSSARSVAWVPGAFVFVAFGLATTTAASQGLPVVVEGTVSIQIADDFEHRRVTIHHFLRLRHTKEMLELKLPAAQAKRIRSGQLLRVHGRRDGKVLHADIDPNAVEVLTEAVSLVAPQAARRVLTLIVDIVDGSGTLHAVNSICDGPDQIVADYMFGSQTGRRNVDGCFQDGSYGALGFGGVGYPGTANDVARVEITYPSPWSSSFCEYPYWGVTADSAAVALGIDLSRYQHTVYVLPRDVNCSWSGLAVLDCDEFCPDCNSCSAWIRDESFPACGYPDVFAHELGHNLGLHHARTDFDNDGVSDCEYCDESDVMGLALNAWRTFNAPHKDFMGWLTDSRLVDGSAGGTFTISALEMLNPPYPQAIKVQSSTGRPYWLSYRAAIGYDGDLSQENLDVLQVHRADGIGDSYLIKGLRDGQTFADPKIGLFVTLLRHSAESADVRVERGGNLSYSLSTTSLSFGKQGLNLTSSPKRITLSNTGGAALPITSIALAGNNPKQFAQTNNCGSSVPASSSCSINVRFKPTSAGLKSAQLSVTPGGGAGASTVSLSGTGVKSVFSIGPTSLAFGKVARNATSTAMNVRIRNTGTVPSPVNSIAIAGTNPGQFAQTNNCTSIVPVGGSCTVRVVFKPKSKGLKTASLKITPGGGAAARTVALTGTGI